MIGLTKLPYRKSLRVLGGVLLLGLPAFLGAQGKAEDYKRAELLKQKLQDVVLNNPEKFQWLGDNSKLWYMQQTARGREFVLADVKGGSRSPAFDQSKLAEKISAVTGKAVGAYSLPFTTVTFIDNNQKIEFALEDKVWQYDLVNDKLIDLNTPVVGQNTGYWGDGANEFIGRPVKSPDGKWTAFIKNYNVYIQSNDSKKETALSFDGSEGEYYSSFISWSPDSKKLVVNKIRPNKPHLVYLIESSPTDQLQPKLHSRNYLKPGDALPQKQPVLFLVESGKQFAVNPALINNQYSLSNPVWRKDSREFTFEYNQRGHQEYTIVGVNATTGEAKKLVDEVVKTFFDYSGKKYRYDVADGKEMIWASERDGWNHLYLYDGITGKVKNQVTKGEWVVRNVVNIDEAGRSIIFAASGKQKDQDPYFLQYYRINFDGTGLTPLTVENGNHTATFSPDHKLFVDTYSRLDEPPVTVIKSATDGKVVMQLERADIKGLLATGWKMPEVFTSKGRDGKTDIWGMIIRPSNFDPNKKYPVIEYIYAGPHSSFVPKSFVTDSRGDLHQLAELGFIVVQLDGMGTSNRSKAFHDVCYKNLKDGGFPDRIIWMKEAAKKYPYMDITRVGIFGNSAGGQSSAGALLFYPDFYKVAVSSSGCHDNRMDKMWWNELWMSFPIGPHYAESSNVTNANKLTGKLMLILGEMDDNVDPSSSMQFINALVKANKTFDFLMVPGMGHSLGGDYGEHKRRDFFVKHLIGVDPPEWHGQQSVVFPSAGN